MVKIKKCITCGMSKDKNEFTLNSNHVQCDKCYIEYKEINGFKKCTKCKEIKQIDNFDKIKSGLHSYCKECKKIDHHKRMNERKNKGIRRCNKCKKIKDISGFGIYNGFIRNTCNDCLNPKIEEIIYRICKKCSTEKPQDEFPSYHNRGKLLLRTMCRECYNKERSNVYTFDEVRKNLKSEYSKEESRSANS